MIQVVIEVHPLLLLGLMALAVIGLVIAAARNAVAAERRERGDR